MKQTVRKMHGFLAACAVILSANRAMAQPTLAPAPTQYEFSDELVKGDLLRPDVAIIESRGKTARSSLVDVRTSFVPELLKSVEDI